MPKLHEMIESKYLRKEDVNGEMVATIAVIGRVNVAMADQPKDEKWAVRFRELKKPMVLNSTNLQLIAKACGSDDSDHWIDKRVVVFVDDNVSFGGKLVGGLRIRPFREHATLGPALTADTISVTPVIAPRTTDANRLLDDIDDDIPM